MLHQVFYEDCNRLSTNRQGVARVRRFHRVLEESAECESPKGCPKVHAVESIDERIHGAVDPAEPGQAIGHIATDQVLRQERYDQVVEEEGQPAHNEAADDDAQRLRRFALSFHRRDAVGE